MPAYIALFKKKEKKLRIGEKAEQGGLDGQQLRPIVPKLRRVPKAFGEMYSALSGKQHNQLVSRKRELDR